MTQMLPLNKLVALAEANEAHAYAHLVQSAAMEGVGVAMEGSLCLLNAPRLPSALVLNRVLGWGVDEAPDEASLERIAAAYGGRGFAIELSPPAATPQVLGWLGARRLRKLSSSQVLVREAAAPAPRYEAWARATGLRVEAVAPEAAHHLARISADNFRLPPLLREIIEAGMRGPRWRRWLAFDGDEPVAGSLTCIEGEVAWFGWASVLPSHRGRWVQSGLVARQLEDAAAAGCRWITTETMQSTQRRPDAAYMQMRRYGFADAYLRPAYVYAPPRPVSSGLSSKVSAAA